MTEETATPADPTSGAGLAGLRAAAVAVIAVGATALWQSLAISEGGGYSTVGPRFLPLFVSLALIVLGALFLGTVTLRPDAYLVRKAAEEHATTHWLTVGLLGVLLLVYAFALGTAGYILATALFVPVTARVLGSQALVRDSVVGVVLAIVLYFGFTEALGVRLPDGVLGPVLDQIG